MYYGRKVDILTPPMFGPSGFVKTRRQAQIDGDWIGTANFWIFSRDPEPSIVYQQRGDKSWAPYKLDASAGGHLRAGEKPIDGLREMQEELGLDLAGSDFTYLGSKLFVTTQKSGLRGNEYLSIYFTESSLPLEKYKLDLEEVYGVTRLPIAKLIKVHEDKDYKFSAEVLTNSGATERIEVSQQFFPENYDNYHYKMALLAQRYFSGESSLIY